MLKIKNMRISIIIFLFILFSYNLICQGNWQDSTIASNNIFNKEKPLILYSGINVGYPLYVNLIVGSELPYNLGCRLGFGFLGYSADLTYAIAKSDKIDFHIFATVGKADDGTSATDIANPTFLFYGGGLDFRLKYIFIKLGMISYFNELGDRKKANEDGLIAFGLIFML